MKRLYDNDLIYGRLLKVSQPHLIERYNKALKAFGLPETKLEVFDIDKTGFSPQVADELGDPDYLDPNGINRRFIILTPSQSTFPVVHTHFSNTEALIYEFFTANARAINALTIKDVIYGEIDDNVSRVNDIEDLLGIEQVEFNVLSADDVLGKAAELRTLVDRLKGEPDAWRNDAMLERMVELARIAGDIRENTLVPDQVVFRHDAFWTSHFGGCYVFVDEKMTTVIADPSAPGFRRSRPWQVAYIPIRDMARVHAFLADTGRLDPPRASWLEPSGFLEHRAEMAIRALLRRAEPDADLGRMDAVWLQTWMHRNAGLINEDGVYPFLNAVKRDIARSGHVDIRDVDNRFRFLLARAKPDHKDAWLVNRLVTEYVPSDFVARYVFNKQGFYKDYESYGDAFRQHVVEMLKTTYLSDKAAFRKRLYGL
ncbi:DUF6638 family protein [Oricola thermophila]|uniref:Uncharacterized protein n=1 Tax=Oricola thermophila TaxID=2742145 RepID=A0A6N1V851_9HYPH|nr:DUF6638 family protein [Oricola thermophila]QKV17070.1 hypothetical protein HTY61_00600 [Oricola thermophila]